LILLVDRQNREGRHQRKYRRRRRRQKQRPALQIEVAAYDQSHAHHEDVDDG
jgi:hypothetical protein